MAHQNFVIKNVFGGVKRNLLKQADDTYMKSKDIESSGVSWNIYLRNSTNYGFSCGLHCLYSGDSTDWEIETEVEFLANNKKVQSTLHYKFSNEPASIDPSRFIYQNEYEKFICDDKVVVECRVSIKKMTGVMKKVGKLMNFDEAGSDFDHALLIGHKQFFVSKMYISFHSSYFKSLFFGNFSESGKSEIDYAKLDPKDFQDFLELIYAASELNDSSIHGILDMARVFDSPKVTARCERFLLRNSKKTLEFKYYMAVEYGLKKLQEHCDEEKQFAVLVGPDSENED